jgi:hypothetical protein
VNQAIDERLDDWIRHYADAGALVKEGIIQQLKDDIIAQRIPF